MPLVTTIIPAYNGASRYLDQAIQSVLAQTCRDLELIVVDDASTDQTARVVLRYPQARYVRRATNGGQAAARNDGARRATGVFLAFLDQDDLWKPTFLEETVPILQCHANAAVVHCDGYQVNEAGEVLEYDGAMKHTRSITQMLRADTTLPPQGLCFAKPVSMPWEAMMTNYSSGKTSIWPFGYSNNTKLSIILTRFTAIACMRITPRGIFPRREH